MENFIDTQTHSNLEFMMETFVTTQTLLNEEFRNQGLLTNKALRWLNPKIDNVVTHAKKLETQISHVDQQQFVSSVSSGSFPGQPEKNPKGHVNVVTTRSVFF